MSTDPFASIPAAQREDCELRTSSRRAPVAEKACGFGSKPKRKARDFNPLERKWFEAHGYTYERTEHKSAWDGRKHDLFGCGDWLAFKGDETLIVQTCAKGDISTRAKKARAIPQIAKWLEGANRRFEVHGWHQPQGKGSRWEVEVREVRREELG
jgi:hypothetical protein